MNNSFPEGAEQILRQNGIDPKNVKSEDAKRLLGNLNKQDTEKLNRLLNDKEELNRLLNSEKAKQIMQKLFGSNGAK